MNTFANMPGYSKIEHPTLSVANSGSPAIVWIGFVTFLITMAVVSRLPHFDKALDPRNIDINGYNVATIVLVMGASWGGFKLLTNLAGKSLVGKTSAYQSFSTFVNYV
jgi:hypothetical protein